MIQYLKYSFFLLTLVGLVACDADSDSSQSIIPAHASAMTAPQVAAAGASGTQLAGSIAVNKVADDKKKTKDATKKKDYWAKIPFTMANFEEVREYVRTYYIDGKINESRAFAEACNQALFGMKAPRQLLPAAFHSARKKHADEEGGLSGKTYKITSGDKYLVHVLPKVDDKKKKAKKAKKKKKKNARLSNEEIMELRKKSKERRTLLETEWSKIAFGKKDLARCLAHIETKSGIAQTSPKFKKFHLATAQGYLYSLDPHSSLVSAAAWDESTRETTDGSFEGIGAILTTRGDFTVVESPLEGRPAFKAGLRAGDTIIKVDGKDIQGLLLGKVVNQIRGPKDTPVALTVRREGVAEDMIITIVRAHIRIKNVSWRMVPHHTDVGYVKLTGFVPKSTEMLEKALEDLTKQAKSGKLRGLIFDLRNNSGGLLQQGVNIADLFLRKGGIVTVKNRIRRDEDYKAHNTGTWDIPLVVLVNDGSASASEIVASAIQDNARGLVVGLRTFGKASVQTLFNPILRKDYYIKLTIARYFSPSGRTIQVVGVKPDVVVQPDIDGKPRVGFREENLSHYLKPINSNYRSPNEKITKQAQDCAKRRGIADKVHAADPNPQIKYDYQLMKGADLLECVIDQRAQAKSVEVP